MKKPAVVLLLFFISGINSAQENSTYDKNQILSILDQQMIAWNKGDIDGYMQGYWQSDSLKFVGKNGITYGWENTLERYKKAYPNKLAMGILKFEILSLEILSNDSAFMLGKWSLQRKDDNPSGYFTLVWKKINGKWVIVTDHSS